jgi:hypothetical protein
VSHSVPLPATVQASTTLALGWWWFDLSVRSLEQLSCQQSLGSEPLTCQWTVWLPSWRATAPVPPFPPQGWALTLRVRHGAAVCGPVKTTDR